MQCRSLASSALKKDPQRARNRLKGRRLVTEQLVATEPGIRVPQDKTLERDRTNTKRWVQVSPNRARIHSHSHSHCNREPLLVRPRAVQGQHRDLLRVQLPRRRRDRHHASHYPRHASHRRSSCHPRDASHRRSNCHPRDASYRYHVHVRRPGGQRMKAQPKKPVTQPPQSELLNVLSFSFSGYALPRETNGRPS
jgi:hypothetical protein